MEDTSRARRLGCSFLVAILAMGVAFTTSPGHADPSEDLLERGLALTASGRCEDAIDLLATFGPADPEYATAALADAQCRIVLQRYAEAVDVLESLREHAPDLPEADLYLAIAAYHDGDIETAARALDRASPRLGDRAETQLYRGILALEEDRYEPAIAFLERARAIDAARTEPMASYYAGVAYARLGRLDQARAHLGRVIEGDAEPAWSDRARQLMSRIERRSVSSRAWQLRATLGFESDDNVVLRGDDATLPEDISDQGDERVMWLLRGSGELLRGRFGMLGLTAEYTGTRHDELDLFDVQYPGGALWWRRPLGERSMLRTEYRFGYAWVDGDPYVVTHSFGPSLVHAWKDAGRSHARVRAFGYSYLDEPDDIPDGVGVPGDPCPVPLVVCGQPGIDESERRARTGIGYEILAGHDVVLPFWEGAIELTPAFRFQQYFGEGSESDYLRIEPRLTGRAALPFGVFASTTVSYAYRPFRSRSSLPDSDTLVAGEQFQPTWRRRRDNVVRASAGLERAFLDVFTAEVRYIFLDNDSNQPSADYDRQMIGGYLTVQLGN